MTTMVYQYGARAPRERDVVIAQMREGQAFYNDLVTAEQVRRASYDELRKTPEVKAVEAELAEVQAALADAKTAYTQRRSSASLKKKLAEDERKRLVATNANPGMIAGARARRDRHASQIAADTAAYRAQIRPLKAREDDLRARLKALRKDAKTPVVEAQERALVETMYAERKRAYHARTGIFWGSKLIHTNAADQAIKTSHTPPPPWSGQVVRDAPRRKRFTGEGRIGVQIQAKVPNPETFFCLEYTDTIGAKATPGSKRSETRRRAVAKLRIGSDEHRDPIWAHIPVLVHRPLPAHARITWVVLHRRLVANRERWFVDVTVSVPDESPAHPRREACGIDLGWRVVDSGLRVAVLATAKTRVDDPAQTWRELVLPDAILSRFDKADSIQAIRDRHFLTLVETISTYLKGMADVPVWLRERTAGIGQWAKYKSRRQAMHLLREWQRHEGDGKVWTALEAWRRHDTHLWQWEAFERRGAQLARREVYRLWARDVAREFGRVVVEEMDLRELARRPADGEDGAVPKQQDEIARRMRQRAAVGDLRLAIVAACAKMGSEFAKSASKDTTRRCAKVGCGQINIWNAAEQVDHTCQFCGTTWDQDVNAAVNLVSSGGVVVTKEVERDEDGRPLGRHARAKRKKAERGRSKEGAQDGGINAA